MDPITLLLIGGGAYAISQAKKNKKEDDTVFTTVNPGGVTTPPPGAPRLTVDKISRIFKRVDFTFTDAGQSIELEHKQNGGVTQRKVGNYFVTAQTLPKEEMDKNGNLIQVPGAVMITVQAKNKPIIIAKRVLIKEKKVIDVK